MPVRASHTFTSGLLYCPLRVTIRVPSRLNDTVLTMPVNPFSSSRDAPVRASHTFAVLVIAAGDDPRAVRAERHAPHIRRVPLQLERGSADLRVPHLHFSRLVFPPAAGDDPRAVRAERHAPHIGRVPLQLEQGAPVRASHTFAVLSALAVTIRARSGLNTARFTEPACPFSSSRGAPVRVPHLRRIVIAAGDDAGALRAICHAMQPIRVPLQLEQGVPVRASHTLAVWS